MKQTKLFSFGNPPLPKGYSPSHILTYRSCPYKFLLEYVYKVKVKTKSEPMIIGSNIHEDISNRILKSDNMNEQRMLDFANGFIAEMPENPQFETNYKDKNNPGKFTGFVFGLPFLAFFDVYWECGIGTDWKSGYYKDKYKDKYEIQAYILNELFKQRYGKGLNKFYFVFLKDGFRYEAQSIYEGNVRRRTGIKIENALRDIKKLEFKKKHSYSCEWCNYKEVCI